VDVTFGTAYSVPLLIDTGAGLVSLPMVAAQALIDAGEAHWSGRIETFTLVDGSTQEKQILIIHRLNIGSHALTNVEASVEPNDDATPLLSFAVLSQIGKFTIDTNAGTLTFG
jgi:predicted aspartyl protease